MKKSTFIIVIAYMLSSSLYAGDTQTLYVETIKQTFEIPFSPDMTIRQIKEVIQEHEGIPVAQQLLQKKEWLRTGIILPSQESVVLEDDKTCFDYDLQNKASIHLFLQLLGK